jgi:hypothetical protein
MTGRNRRATGQSSESRFQDILLLAARHQYTMDHIIWPQYLRLSKLGENQPSSASKAESGRLLSSLV